MDIVTGGTVIGSIFASQEFMKTIYEDLTQPSVRKVGQALATIVDYGQTVLTFMGDKQKILLNKRLQEYKERIANIPDHKIAEVPSEIAIPVVQRLSYLKNDDIADLFLKLLTSASSTDTCHRALPGYIRILDCLSVDEARIIQHLAKLRISHFPCLVLYLYPPAMPRLITIKF